jgi:hypothetical protein
MAATALLYIPLRQLEKHWRGVWWTLKDCWNLESVESSVKLGVKFQDQINEDWAFNVRPKVSISSLWLRPRFVRVRVISVFLIRQVHITTIPTGLSAQTFEF